MDEKGYRRDHMNELVYKAQKGDSKAIELLIKENNRFSLECGKKISK